MWWGSSAPFSSWTHPLSDPPTYETGGVRPLFGTGFTESQVVAKHRQVRLNLAARPDEIGMLDAQLARDPANLVVFQDRHVRVGGRDGKEAAEESHALLARCLRRELERDVQVVRAAEPAALGEGELDDGRRLVGGERAFLGDQPLHHVPLAGCDLDVGT